MGATFKLMHTNNYLVWYLKDKMKVKLHRNAISKIQIVKKASGQMTWFIPKINCTETKKEMEGEGSVIKAT